MKFNENLKYLRKEAGLTQEQLAEQLNVSRQAVTKWESGQALPDIENLKEISIIFSVTVDSLIGEVETKSTLRIKKRIDDLGWFMFAEIFLLLFCFILPLYNFFNKILNNEDVSVLIMILLGIGAFISIVFFTKKYLKNYKQKIINMKNTVEAKKERRNIYIKKGMYLSSTWILISLVQNLDFLSDGDINLYLSNLIYSLVIGGIIDSIFIVYNYLKLEKKVKELNKE